MRRLNHSVVFTIGIVLGLLFSSSVTEAQAPPIGGPKVQVQVASVINGTYSGLNFLTGCTVSAQASSVAQLTCSGTGGVLTGSGITAPAATPLTFTSNQANGTTAAFSFNAVGTFANNNIFNINNNTNKMCFGLGVGASNKAELDGYNCSTGVFNSGFLFGSALIDPNGTTTALGHTNRFTIIGAKAYESSAQTIAQSSSPATLDAGAGSVLVVTLTANIAAWSITNCLVGQRVMITWVQGAGQPWTLAGADASIKFLPTLYLGVTHTAPTLTTTAAARDTEVFLCEDATHILEIARNFNN